MTADPLSVALDAWHTACDEGGTTIQAMQHVFDALTAAGYAVVQVAERRDEHTVDGAGRSVHRIVHAGPWQPDPAAPDPDPAATAQLRETLDAIDRASGMPDQDRIR